MESSGFKIGLRKLSQGFGVFRQQNAFRTAQVFRKVGFLFFRCSLPLMKWEINLKRRPLPRGAVHRNIPVALFHDSIHRRESKSRSLAPLFGGKEWLTDMCKRSGVHPT